MLPRESDGTLNCVFAGDCTPDRRGPRIDERARVCHFLVAHRRVIFVPCTLCTAREYKIIMHPVYNFRSFTLLRTYYKMRSERYRVSVKTRSIAAYAV